MKFYSSQALFGTLVPLAAAFPAAVFEQARNDPAVTARALEIMGKRDAADAEKIFEPIPIFNAKAQYIDVSPGSGHEFVAPDFSKGDLRGLCPGLNALANHVSK